MSNLSMISLKDVKDCRKTTCKILQTCKMKITTCKTCRTTKFNNKKMNRTEAIVLSMTPEERRKPEIIKGSRRQRIAAGSGTSLVEVNQLIKQFGEMRKMMKSPSKMKGLMRQMGGSGGLGDMMKNMGGGKFPGGKFPF
ncbi:MAG: hypothetical protein EOP84_16600 [Verrucomicrobiaceae bacterium]|nr:MAG: hypothetical protein EOP84_16600 [Verrucomicrobiaceae bacterium]